MGQFSLADILSKSSYLVCLTGREMMVEDGIDSMRDMKTAYEIELKYGYSPEEVFSAQFFSTRPEQFYEFYRSEVLAQAKEPGKAYGALAALEKTGILKCVITRQLFNLEKRAGCQNVYNLHGNIYENNHCPRCGRIYPMDYMKKGKVKYAFGNVPVKVAINGAAAVDKYVKEMYGEEAKVVRKIYKYQLINYEGQLCYISGTKEQQNATEIYVAPKFEELLWLVEKGKVDILSGKPDKDGEIKDFNGLIKEFIPHICFIIRKKLPLYANLADKLEEIESEYLDEMTTEEKVKLLLDVMLACHTGAGLINIDKRLGGGGSFGRLQKTIDPSEVDWVDMSLTGLYTRTTKGV